MIFIKQPTFLNSVNYLFKWVALGVENMAYDEKLDLRIKKFAKTLPAK